MFNGKGFTWGPDDARTKRVTEKAMDSLELEAELNV